MRGGVCCGVWDVWGVHLSPLGAGKLDRRQESVIHRRVPVIDHHHTAQTGLTGPSAQERPHGHAGTAGPPPDIAQLKSQWGEYQRRHGLKTTNQRELIVDVFLRCSDHVSVEELLTRVRERSAKVGYATVYRTMKLLVEASLAAPRQFGDGQTRYEVAGAEMPHHDHLICVQCGLILEFENDEIEALQDKVANRLGGFHIVRHKLELYGLCPKARGIPNGACPDHESRLGSAVGGVVGRAAPGPAAVGDDLAPRAGHERPGGDEAQSPTFAGGEDEDEV